MTPRQPLSATSQAASWAVALGPGVHSACCRPGGWHRDSAARASLCRRGVWGRTTNEDLRKVSASLTPLPQTRPRLEPQFSVLGRKD